VRRKCVQISNDKQSIDSNVTRRNVICLFLEFSILLVRDRAVCILLLHFTGCLSFVIMRRVEEYCDMHQ